MGRQWDPNGLACRQQTDHHCPQHPNTFVRTTQRSNNHRGSDPTKQTSPRTRHHTTTNYNSLTGTNTCRAAPQRTGTRHQHGYFAKRTTYPSHPQGQHNGGDSSPTRIHGSRNTTTTTRGSTTARANRHRNSTAPRRNARRGKLRRAAQPPSLITGTRQEQEPRPHG